MPSLSAPTLFYTGLAILGFAANALFARPALGTGRIDPASYALTRAATGAITLIFLLALTRRARPKIERRHVPTALALFGYLAFFSFAYVTIQVPAGSLIGFGAVQVVMLGAGYLRGERMAAVKWTGFAAAVGGLVYLVSPGLSAPPVGGALLMFGAGTSWGAYSILSKRRSSTDPLADTTANFILAAPLAGVVALAVYPSLHWTGTGLLLGALSGAVSSALGYLFWYAALRGLTATQGAVVQLLAPVVATAGGVLILHEPLSPRVLVAGALILGGVSIVVAGRSRSTHRERP